MYAVLISPHVPFLAGASFFIFCTIPLPTPELTQSHIKWVWEGAVSSWVKLLGRECDHSRPSSGEVKIEWRYAFPPAVRLHVEGQLCLYLEIQFIFFLCGLLSLIKRYGEYKQQSLIFRWFVPVVCNYKYHK